MTDQTNAELIAEAPPPGWYNSGVVAAPALMAILREYVEAQDPRHVVGGQQPARAHPHPDDAPLNGMESPA